MISPIETMIYGFRSPREAMVFSSRQGATAPFAVDADQRPKLRAEVREKLSERGEANGDVMGRNPAPVGN